MKKLIATICFLGLAGLVVGVGVFAGDSANITCTVTIQQVTISISVDTSTIDYGQMATNETKLSSEVTHSPYITLTNESSVFIDLFAKGADTTDGQGGSWALSDVEIGPDQYMHQVCANCGEWNDGLAVSLFTENQELPPLGNMNPGQQALLEFRFHTPSSFSNFNPQSSAITLTAVEGEPFSDVILDNVANVDDGFGSVFSAGDVNSDGYDDVAVTTRWHNNGTGRVYIYYGGPNMDSTPDVILDGETAGDNFSVLSSIGDINNDGYDDVIVGAYKYNGLTGRAYIYFGGSEMDSTSDIILDGEIAGDYFGWTLSSGDVNNDAYMDVIVGAPGHIDGTGRTYVYYGGPDGLDSVFDVVFDGENPWDYFGDTLSSGDVNNDGYGDVIVGADYYNQGDETGRVYVYYGGDSMDSTPDITLDAENPGDWFGSSIFSADVNNDGYGDVIVGAAGYNSGEWTGRVYVFYGSSSMDSTYDVVFDAEVQWGEFGWPVSSADVNNDGYDDVIVNGYCDWDIYPEGNGCVQIFYGGISMDSTSDITLVGETANNNDQFGYNYYGLSSADVNNDGYDDVIIGAPAYNNWFGRAYIFLGPDL